MRLDLWRFLGTYLNHIPQSCDSQASDSLNANEWVLSRLWLVLTRVDLLAVVANNIQGILHLFFECHKPSFAGFFEVVQLW